MTRHMHLATDDPDLVDFFTNPMRLPTAVGCVKIAEVADGGVLITRPELLRDLEDHEDGKVDFNYGTNPVVWVSGIDYPLTEV